MELKKRRRSVVRFDAIGAAPFSFSLALDRAWKRIIDLRANKGYAFPPWCIRSCSFLIKDELDITKVLGEALWNETSREIVKENFERQFGDVYHNECSVSERIKNLINEKTERSGI